MTFKRRSRRARSDYPEIYQAQKKRELTRESVSKEEWDAFEEITTYCRDDSRTIALDLLTLAEKNHITTLSLSRQALKLVPPVIQQLSYLKQLLLIENQLTSLPPEIEALNQLEILYLDKNPLKTVPKEILILPSLQQLSLGETNLHKIPTWIEQLDKLTHLWLNDNVLSSLPCTLSNLANLERLDLRGNPRMKAKINRNWTGKALDEFLANLCQEK